MSERGTDLKDMIIQKKKKNEDLNKIQGEVIKMKYFAHTSWKCEAGQVMEGFSNNFFIGFNHQLADHLL